MEQETINILIVVIAAVLTFIGGLLTWWLNARSKRIYEEYINKEAKYSELIRSLKGFYIESENKASINEFLDQLKLCWMYCPDEVIWKANGFLKMVHKDNDFPVGGMCYLYCWLPKRLWADFLAVGVRWDRVCQRQCKDS